MFFKSPRFLVIASLGIGFVLGGLVGCGDLLNEKPLASQAPETKLSFDTGCLSNVLPTMKAFMNGESNAPALKATWNCFALATREFSKYVRGIEPGKYTGREVAGFFENYLLGGIRINDTLLLEILHLKQLFVGGSETHITKQEMEGLALFAEDMRDLSIELLPHMKILSQSWAVADRNMDVFEEANVVIQKAARHLADRIRRNNQNYRLTNLVVLLREMSHLYDENWPIVDSFEKAMPFVQKLKVSLTGGDEAVVAAPEWTRFGLALARGYVQYLRFVYFIDDDTTSSAPVKLTYIFRSIEDLFSFLRDMVETKPGQVLTRQELWEVLVSIKKIFPDFTFSDELLTQIMKVKKLLFGGETDRWTIRDFLNAQGKVDDFKEMSEDILDNKDLYTLKWDPSKLSEVDAQKTFRLAEQRLVDVSQKLSRFLETEYDMDDLSRLLYELDKLFAKAGSFFSSTQTLPAKIDQYLPIVETYKNIVLNDHGSIIFINQWSDFFKYGINLFNRYLYYSYFLENRTTRSGPGLESLEILFNDAQNLLLQIFDNKGGLHGKISLEEVLRLLKSLSAADVLPASWPLEEVQGLAEVVVNRILVPPNQRLAGFKPMGVDRDSVNVLREELSYWIDNQRFLEKAFHGQAWITKAQLLAEAATQTKTSGLLELLRCFSSPVDMAHDTLDRVIFTVKSNATRFSFSSVSITNLARTVVRLVMRAYAEELDRTETNPNLNPHANASFSLSEARTLYSHLKPIMVKLGKLEPDNVLFPDKRFREANLFTRNGNGEDGFVNFEEGVDILLHLFSGINIDDLISKDLSEQCNAVNDGGTSKLKFTLDCYVRVYHRALKYQLASMPYFRNYLAAMAYNESAPLDSAFGKAMIDLLKASGTTDLAAGSALSSDLSLVPHAMQFIEMVLQRYDQDLNGWLNKDEGLSSLPTFLPTLKRLGGFKDDKTNRALLAYILEHGKPPISTGEKLKFYLFYKGAESSWKINADRMQITSILAFIAEAANSN